MPAAKMHANEVETDVDLVRRLIAAQFPHWAGLPIQPVPSAGTDNALYRLGVDMVARMPRIHWAVGQVEKETIWLPRLASHLPFAITLPLAMGEPGEGYPWHWSVCSWLEGENATLEDLSDSRRTVKDLAKFITALHRIDPTGGPPPGQHNSFRGVPLAARDTMTRTAIAALDGMIESVSATEAWEAALQAPAWQDAPVWIHGDIQSGNLLFRGGRLSAVIDFGCLGVGDPACDLIVAWNFLTAELREEFRRAIQVDEDTWRRGRGWALSVALVALPYYKDTNPALAGNSFYTIKEVLA
jgi:aminoglycoside phosphotransferase (APT) family kinase protein